MAVLSTEMLNKIMPPNGPTKKLVALREEADLPRPGFWHRDFMSVFNVAEATGKPLVAVWTNGDLCGFCQRFANNALDPVFLDWMRQSDCYFWLGGSMDPENQRTGDGWKFLTGSGLMGYFPFVGVIQMKDRKPVHRFFGAGHDLDQRKQGADGARAAVEALQRILSEPPQNLDARRKELQAERERQGSGRQGGCPGGHPHLKALQQIREILKPFFPAAQGSIRVMFAPDQDPARRLRIVQAIADNGGHCPCKPEKTPDTICLCREFRETGKCACGLFTEKDGGFK